MSYSPIDPTVLTGVLNNQGTQATSALQQTQVSLAQNGTSTTTVVMNGQGTLATSTNQNTTNALLQNGTATATVIMNAQGTLASSVNQQTGNSTLQIIMNSLGTLATSTQAGSIVSDASLANVTNTFGPTGTHAAANLATEISLNPDAASTDSFGRLRVSNADYRFDGQLVYTAGSDVWDTWFSTGGTVTYDRTDRLVQLTATANGTSIFQSHYHAPYTPGRSQLSFTTFTAGTTPGYAAMRRVGYFDGTNGICLEQNWDGNYLNLLSSTNNGTQRIAQANWNIDTMLGNGRSGLTLDLTKTQIFGVSMQALYVGRVVVGFDIDGNFWPIHAFTHANKISAPYIAQASLPVRYEVRSSGSNVVTMKGICASVISEGGGPLVDIPGRTFTQSAPTATVSTRRPLLSIRVRELFNQIPCNGLVLPQAVSTRNNTNDILVEIVRNGVLATPVWIYEDVGASIVEYDTSATTITGGSPIWSGYSLTSQGLSTPLTNNMLSRLVVAYSHLLGQGDILSIVATSVSGNAATVCNMTWKEIR